MLVLYVGFFGFSLFSKVLTFDFKFGQNDYKLKFEWAELVSYNKVAINKAEVHTFKYNRTTTAVNLTLQFNIEVGHDLELVFQAYKFASNEYRLFPLRCQVNFCEIVAKNLLGAKRILDCGNFKGCPVRKGVHICNWSPDEAQFPAFIPNGKYKLQVQALYHNAEILLANTYGEVYRPFVDKNMG